MKKIGTVIAFTMIATGASAADLIVLAPAPVAVEKAPLDWTGFYVGAHAGWGKGKVKGSNSMSPPSDTTAYFEAPTGPFDDGDIDMDGWFGGGQVGYMWQNENNWVGGLEADVSFASIKGDNDNVSYDGDGIPGFYGVKSRTKIDMFGTVRGKVGYAYDRFLPFVTGGLAWVNVKSEFTTVDMRDSSPDRSTFSSSSATHFGWTVGTGVEYAITDHWRTKIEYRYHDFRKSFSDAYKTDIKPTLHTVQVGLSYKF